MKNEMNLRELADNEGLRYVETTSEANGYPRHIKGAIIGFDTFEDAEALAEEHGLTIMQLHKRDGWQLWYRRGETYEAMEITSGDYGDDYSELLQMDAEDFYSEEVEPMLDNFATLAELRTFIEEKEELWEEVENLEEDEVIITYEGRYYETIKQKTMSWSFDTHNYEIGLVAL